MSVGAVSDCSKLLRFADMWPFKYVNGEQTPESVALETIKQPKPLTQYEQVLSDPETEESPL